MSVGLDILQLRAFIDLPPGVQKSEGHGTVPSCSPRPKRALANEFPGAIANLGPSPAHWPGDLPGRIRTHRVRVRPIRWAIAGTIVSVQGGT